MLLVQPFDPLKEKRLPFFARSRIISRTRQALFDLKNKMHNHRQFPVVMMPDHHYMLSQQPLPPPPWFCYNCCCDPHLMFPPPPPLIQPYSICVHISSHDTTPSVTESTVCNPSSSSMYNIDEKESIEEVEEYRPTRQPGPVMNRSQSEIMTSRPRHRPSVNRWNSDNLYYD